jgi:hypothetical protein
MIFPLLAVRDRMVAFTEQAFHAVPAHLIRVRNAKRHVPCPTSSGCCWPGVGCFIAGVICCALVITLPLAVTSFRIANFAL